MLIHLLHNPNAGLTPKETQHLVQEIADAGHDVIALSLPDAYEEYGGQSCDLLAVAGGDGTIEKVVRRFYKKAINFSVPLFIIPEGTANNIAKSLGIEADLKTSLHFPKEADVEPRCARAHLAVGSISAPKLNRLFVESVGCGLITRLIQTDKSKSKSHPIASIGQQKLLHHQVNLLVDLLHRFEASDYQLSIDGQDYSGCYLAVEIMNIAKIGPGIELAPGKDPGAATVDVVILKGDQKKHLREFLLGLPEGSGTPPYPFTRIKGQDIRLTCRQADMHIDDKPLEGEQTATFSVQASVHYIAIANQLAAANIHSSDNRG